MSMGMRWLPLAKHWRVVSCMNQRWELRVLHKCLPRAGPLQRACWRNLRCWCCNRCCRCRCCLRRGRGWGRWRLRSRPRRTRQQRPSERQWKASWCGKVVFWGEVEVFLRRKGRSVTSDTLNVKVSFYTPTTTPHFLCFPPTPSIVQAKLVNMNFPSNCLCVKG